MKAVCLLICLALARYSAGHIFRRQHYPEMDGLIVQPLEYMDQYQGPQYQQQYQQPYQQHKQPHRDQQQHQQDKQHLREQLQQHQRSSEETQQKYYERIQQKQQLQNLQQYKQHQKHETNRQTSDSTSNESNSMETRVRINEYAAPLYADDVEKSNTRLNAAVRRNQHKMIPYGDAIAWNGVQIATGPQSPVTKDDIEKIFAKAYKTMQHVSKEDKKTFHNAFEVAAKSDNEDVQLNATQLLQKHNYEVEEHTIKTDDGYYVTLFRIPSKFRSLVKKPVVFLMHGLLGSADDWLLMGPGKSLAYLLADAGYEVWLGNSRGSKYSRRHVSKHPAQADFWQFGTDEIALHDLPAMIDYALKTSDQEKLYYVGHSQGTTAFFALASTRPEYNDKIIMMYALSPMAYMSEARSPMLRMIAPTSPFYERLHQQLGHGQFKPSKELVHTVGGAMCENEIGCRNVCSNVNFVMSGVNVQDWEVELIPVIMGHLPAGGSTRQIKQYAQAVASNEFTKYDFGAEMNQKVYGDSQPPKYEMEKVRTPVALYYSEEDWLAHPTDVQRLENKLPNVKDSYKIPVKHFNHMDFQFSKQAPEVVFKRLIDSIQQQQQDQQHYVY